MPEIGDVVRDTRVKNGGRSHGVVYAIYNQDEAIGIFGVGKENGGTWEGAAEEFAERWQCPIDDVERAEFCALLAKEGQFSYAIDALADAVLKLSAEIRTIKDALTSNRSVQRNEGGA